MKTLIFLLSMLSSLQAFASTECLGRSSGALVSVKFITGVPNNTPQRGTVRIADGVKLYVYKIASRDIAQYYERPLYPDSNTLFGVNAFLENGSPVDIYYVGLNYSDRSLIEAVKDKNRKPMNNGSRMYIWRGPGFAATEQYQVTDFVCGVWY